MKIIDEVEVFLFLNAKKRGKAADGSDGLPPFSSLLYMLVCLVRLEGLFE